MANGQNGRRKLHQYCQKLKKIFQRSSTGTNQIHSVHKTIQTVKFYYTLNGNIAVTMTLPRFRCLVEFQGVMEQNVACTPR